MHAETHILDTAAGMVAHAKHHAEEMRAELEKLDKRKAEIEAELRAVELKAGRIASFKAHDGTHYHCPRCWIEEESISHLVMKTGGNWRAEYLICDLCALEIGVAES